MPSREYCYLVKESSYGVPVASPVLGTDAFYLRLDGGNAFSMQMDPVILDIMYGGGRATPAFPVADMFRCSGRLQTKLYAGALGNTLMDWALTPIDAGRTAPWVTTDASFLMPVTDLASMSIYHARQRNDSTYDLRRYGGVKVTGGTLEGSRDAQVFTLSLDIQGISDNKKADQSAGYPDGTEFPPPAEIDYPSNPFVFSNTGGQLSIGSTRTLYGNINISFRNVTDAKWFESQYVQIIRCLGRTTTLSSRIYMKPSPDDLTLYQSLTEQTTSVGIDNGTHAMTIDFKGNSFIKPMKRDLPLDKVYEWDLTVQNYWDSAAGVDLTFAGT